MKTNIKQNKAKSLKRRNKIIANIISSLPIKEVNRRIKKIKRNCKKVYTEFRKQPMTFAATILTIAAFLATCFQLYIVMKQTELINMQEIIERKNISPQFTVNVSMIMDEEQQYVTDDKLVINNYGGLAYEIKVETVVLLQITYSTMGEYPEPIQVPINGYYTAHLYSTDPMGLVMVITGYHNNLRTKIIREELRILAKERNANADYDILRYVQIAYKDILGNSHTEYYFVQA